MADATATTQPTDTIAAIDIESIAIKPIAQLVFYRLRLTWSSGAITFRENTVGNADFIACISSFCQATPRKKLLTYLSSAGYEPNLTPS